MPKTITIDKAYKGMRLDTFLNEHVLKEESRSFIQNKIKSGEITINDLKVKTGYTIKGDEVLKIADFSTQTLAIEPVKLDFEIVYEDEDLFVINKPQGLVVHPASSYQKPTLVHGLLYQADHLSSINGVIRPGIVHRIDKDTSGLLIVAKTDQAHQLLSEDLKYHRIERFYQAIVSGVIREDKGTIDAPIARHPIHRLKMSVNDQGKAAITHFQVIERFNHATLIECRLETGRTHQIRVHMHYIKHPILGDPLYGIKEQKEDSGQYLHAFKLSFIHPIKKEQMTFTADLPENFKMKLAMLRKDFAS